MSARHWAVMLITHLRPTTKSKKPLSCDLKTCGRVISYNARTQCTAKMASWQRIATRQRTDLQFATDVDDWKRATGKRWDRHQSFAEGRFVGGVEHTRDYVIILLVSVHHNRMLLEFHVSNWAWRQLTTIHRQNRKNIYIYIYIYISLGVASKRNLYCAGKTARIALYIFKSANDVTESDCTIDDWLQVESNDFNCLTLRKNSSTLILLITGTPKSRYGLCASTS